MQDFRKLVAWQKAHALTLAMHRAFADVPRGRYPGLRSQCLRAAASIPANLAEGCGRMSRAELARFSDIALGSAKELEYHLLLARDLQLLEHRKAEALAADLDEVRRMLYSLGRSIRQRIAAGVEGKEAVGRES